MLNAWTEQGYNLRFVLTEALLLLGYPCSSSHPSREDLASNAVLDQISQVIEIVKAIQPNQPTLPSSDHGSPTLPDSFLVAIKERVKPGIKDESVKSD